MLVGRRTWAAIAYAPILVAFWVNFMFVRNHFYVAGPFLHDSGWFSALVWRNGVMPRSPVTVAADVVHYWGWHPSILLSAGSAVSYLFPGDRVEWYCIFQGAIYAPLGVAFPLLVPREYRTSLGSALLAAVAGLTLVFSGQVVSCSSYPHFEIFSSAGIVIMLASLATGRERLAWIGLAMSIATREDGGFHAAAFLAAVLAADFTGHAFPIARRRVVYLTMAAVAGTAVLMFIQKKFFVSPEAWKNYLSGDPPYAHVTRAFLATRLRGFADGCAFIWLPFAFTAMAAIARRDWRYMLGWVVTIPWLVLNLTALQDVKGAIGIYTGFPFVAAAFWAAAYARGGDRASVRIGWRWGLVSGAMLGLTSLLGLYEGYPYPVEVFFRDSSFPHDRNPEGIRAFARELRSGKHGHVRMDPSMASWAIEAVAPPDVVTMAELPTGVRTADGFALWAIPDPVSLLLRSPFTKCGRVPRTPVLFCTLPDRPLPDDVVPTSPLLAASLAFSAPAHRVGETVEVDAAPFAAATTGPFVKLVPGRYRVTWDIELRTCAAPAVMVPVDVFRGGHTVVAAAAASATLTRPGIEFEATEATKDEIWEFRTFTTACPFVLRGIDLQRIAAETPGDGANAP